jgi:hypothetical protein
MRKNISYTNINEEEYLLHKHKWALMEKDIDDVPKNPNSLGIELPG